MRILRLKPYEEDLIRVYYTLKFLRSLTLTTALLFPFIIKSNDKSSLYFLSIALIVEVFLLIRYSDKFHKMKFIKMNFKYHRKIFQTEHEGETMLTTDFFLRFDKRELRYGQRITFVLDGKELAALDVDDLLISLGDNHFVILHTDQHIDNLGSLDCFLFDKENEVIASKSLRYLFDD